MLDTCSPKMRSAPAALRSRSLSEMRVVTALIVIVPAENAEVADLRRWFSESSEIRDDVVLERARKRLDKRARKGFRGYPVATVALYGPDDTDSELRCHGIVCLSACGTSPARASMG